MFQIWHTYNKSRSLDYATMKIEVINFSWWSLMATCCLSSPSSVTHLLLPA
jgi:hypothetical protein